MTPLATQILRSHPFLATEMAKAQYFNVHDLTAIVRELNDKTYQHLLRTGERPDFDPTPKMPADNVWLEFDADLLYGGGRKRKIGLFLVTEKPGIIEGIPINIPDPVEGGDAMDFRFSYEPGAEYCQMTLAGGTHPERSELLGKLATLGRVFLDLLIDHRNILDTETRERTTKQFGRALRAAGQKEPKVTLTKCSINMGHHGPAPEEGDGHPRNLPLHFVRGHNRNLASGKTTFVRPHWRGSAEFGIGLKSYEAKDER